MIRKHTILPIFALAVLFLAPSCQKDRGYSIADDGSLMLQVMLPVEQFTKASETGADELNENKVSTLDVFIYQEGEEACVHYQRITPAAGLVRYGLTKMQKDFCPERRVYGICRSERRDGHRQCEKPRRIESGRHRRSVGSRCGTVCAADGRKIGGNGAERRYEHKQKHRCIAQKGCCQNPGKPQLRYGLPAHRPGNEETGQLRVRQPDAGKRRRLFARPPCHDCVLYEYGCRFGRYGSNHLLFIRKRLEQRSSRRDIHLPERTDPKRSGYRKPLLQKFPQTTGSRPMGMTRPTCTNCGATTFTTSLRISTATEDRAHRKRLH